MCKWKVESPKSVGSTMFSQFNTDIHVSGNGSSRVSMLFQKSSFSSWKALNTKSLKRLEYCFGSTAEIDVGSYWNDLYAC
jgi:hypothetical protein